MTKDSQETGKFWNASWNFVYGCTPVGAGCTNCWAKANHERWGSGEHPLEVFSHPFGEVHVFPERIAMPLRWKKPQVIAVNFSGDTFHKKVPASILGQAWRVMEDCPQHTFIVLTKRWKRMCSILTNTEPLPNVHLGVSVSAQAELDAAMPHLLATPAAVRIISAEPLLERLDLEHVQFDSVEVNCITGDHGVIRPHRGRSDKRIGQVYVGCETGPKRRPKRRPCKIEWIESIVGQCRAAGVPVWVKGVEINGRVLHDMSEWPASIRVRELPG